RGAAHARAKTGKRSGNVLVDRARCGALGIELGIVLVGLHQRKIHCAGARAPSYQPPAIAVLSFAVLSIAGLPIAGLPTCRLPVGGLLTEGLGSGKRRERKDAACGKRCTARNARNRSPPQTPRPHAQTPPAVPPNAVAAVD